jgi:hypothetical protein
MRATDEDKSDYKRDDFSGKLECVENQFPKYHTKILFRNFNAKVGRQIIYKPTVEMRTYMKLVTIMKLE